MDNVNKTLYIPLYGKAYVSRKGIILRDTKSEEIWEKESFPLKGKSKSKWLAYYMGMRAALFDQWLKEQMAEAEDPVVIHLGCGMDSRIDRVGTGKVSWFDVDFPDVIRERRRYYTENSGYRMLSSDVRNPEWIRDIPGTGTAIVVMEGLSMYLRPDELRKVLGMIGDHFSEVRVLMDCYTSFAAKMSRIRNPINDVGGANVYGIDDPRMLQEGTGLVFVKEHEMTPLPLIEELQGMEKIIFRKIYAGGISRKMYRMYEFKSSD